LAGDVRKMASNATYMTHNPWSVVSGESADMLKTAEILQKFKQTLITTYQDATGLEAEEISQMMDDESWMTADEALEKGFITEITEATKEAAGYHKSDLKSLASEKFKALLGDPEPDNGQEHKEDEISNLKSGFKQEKQKAADRAVQAYVNTQKQIFECCKASGRTDLAAELMLNCKDLKTARQELQIKQAAEDAVSSVSSHVDPDSEAKGQKPSAAVLKINARRGKNKR